jgi:hypothetical protein
MGEAMTMTCDRQTLYLRSARALALTLGALMLIPTAAQRAHGGTRSGPMEVTGFRGQFCRSMGPRGWAVIAENPQRVGFGADLLSGDGKAAASFSIFGAGTLNRMPGFDNPDRAVATSVSHLGRDRIQFGQRRQIDRNVFTISYQTPQTEGMAFWQVMPAQNGGYMIVLRTAYTQSGFWRGRGAEASAVARSLHCNVPSVPAAPDPPALNAKPKSGNPEEGAESDSLYNVWLDKEYFHNAQTGENFWVSPSSDFQQNGPQGPGYYANQGNEVVKLQSGYAQ